MWFIYALMAAVLWGVNYSLSEKIFQNKVNPPTLLAIQMTVAALIFGIGWCNQLRSQIILITHNRYLLYLVIIEIISAITGNYFVVTSIQAKNATLAGLIELSYPLFTVFFTWLIFKENHLTWSTVVGGMLIMSGIVLIGLNEI